MRQVLAWLHDQVNWVESPFRIVTGEAEMAAAGRTRTFTRVRAVADPAFANGGQGVSGGDGRGYLHRTGGADRSDVRIDSNRIGMVGAPDKGAGLAGVYHRRSGVDMGLGRRRRSRCLDSQTDSGPWFSLEKHPKVVAGFKGNIGFKGFFVSIEEFMQRNELPVDQDVSVLDRAFPDNGQKPPSNPWGIKMMFGFVDMPTADGHCFRPEKKRGVLCSD